ncbi:MAG: hypothetical protein H0U55_03780 [Rubrobacteraceae bacterium]|nr:hypothetical protein [Rubrobacteraceae bacterium]
MQARVMTFREGHIRVEVTASSFPRPRNPSTNEDTQYSSRGEVAHQRVFHDPERQSRIALTVVDG